MAEDEQTGQALKTRFLAPEIKSGKKNSQWLFKKGKIQGNHAARLSYASPVSALFTPSHH